jgi:hypothetical protein
MLASILAVKMFKTRHNQRSLSDTLRFVCLGQFLTGWLTFHLDVINEARLAPEYDYY